MELAFIQENYVIEVYEKLTNSDPFKGDSENVDFLMDYFEDNYIGLVQRGRRLQPRQGINLQISDIARQLCAWGRAMKLAPLCPKFIFSNFQFSFEILEFKF